MGVSISIAITMHNNQKRVNEALASIDQAISVLDHEQQKNFEIIIIDDNSNEGEQLNTNYKTPIRIHRNPERIGVGASRNKGFHEAKHPYVLNMDADVKLRQDNLKKIIDVIERDPEIDILQTLVSSEPVGENPSSFQKYLASAFYVESILDVEINENPMLLNSMCFLAKKEKFLACGGFSQEYKDNTGDEFEVMNRIGSLRIVQENSILIDHFFEYYLGRMKKLFRRSKVYLDLTLLNDTFPTYLKIIGSIKAIGSIGIIVGLWTSLISSNAGLTIVITSCLSLILADKGKLLSVFYKKVGSLKCALLIPYIFSEYTVVVLGTFLNLFKKAAHAK